MKLSDKMNLKHIDDAMRKILSRLVPFIKVSALLLVLLPAVVSASVFMIPSGSGSNNATSPSKYGFHNETIEDMRVKVMGGYVRVLRSWEEEQWVLNSRWAPLQVEMCDNGTDICAVKRYRTRYEKVDDTTFRHERTPRETIVKTTTGFEWRDRKGNWVKYGDESFGYKATSYGDRNNVTVTFQYSNDRLAGVFDHFGNQVLWYGYDGEGRIAYVRDYTDRQVTYHFDNPGSSFETGRLVSVTDVRGNTWSYTYDGGYAGAFVGIFPYKLLSKTDPDGRVQTITYGTTGLINTMTDDNYVDLTYKHEYNKTTREFYKQIRTPSGKVTEIWFDKRGDIIRRDINGSTRWKLSKAGTTWTVTDHAGFNTVKILDEWENVTRVTHPDNSFTTTTYDAKYSNVLERTNENGVVTKYEYDANGNLERKTEALGRPEQRVITYGYDSYGNQTSVNYLADGNSPLVTYGSTYDDYGNMATYTDGENNVWIFTHDAMGNVLTLKEPNSTNTWTYTYDNAGNQTSMTTPLNHVTQYEYDGRGNRTKVIDAKLHNTTYTYNNKNRLTTITDHLDNSVVLAYDIDGRPIQVTDQANKIKSITYDLDGRPLTIKDGSNNTIQLTYNAEQTNGAGQVGNIQFPTFNRVLSYDKRGRVISQTDVLSGAEQLVTALVYDSVGNLIQTTDPKNRSTNHEYDGLNRIIKIVDPLTQETIFGFDNRGNLRTVTDPKSNTTTYVYNGNNRLLNETRPMGQITAYSYNNSGRLATRVDSKDQKTEYLYDDAGRYDIINSYTTSSSTTPAKTVDLNYDAVNLLSSYNDGTTSATYVYDDLNRKTQETVNFGPFSKTFGYSYAANGLKQSFTAPDNAVHTFSYNASNQLSSIQIPGSGAITVNSYEWLRPKSITFPGGATANLNFDNLLRLTDINIKDPAQNDVMNYGYTLDEVGNILNQQTEHGAYTFGYDDLDRLTSADNPNIADETYTYDPVGNRLTDNNKPGTWGYNANNQLTDIGNTTTVYGYDDNGSLISKSEGATTTTFVYNLDNRLSEVNQGATTVATYYYDPFGRRLSKNVGGVVTYFMYADEGLIAEFDTSGTPIRQYGYQPDSTWGTDPVYLKTGGQYYYYQNDHLGTPKKLTASNGQVVWSAEYQSFGAAQIAAYSTIENSLRFAGQYYDTETGLHYNYFRYYDPSTGRYVTSDPSRYLGEINMYSYVGSNPLSYIDPYGLWASQVTSVHQAANRVGVNRRATTRSQRRANERRISILNRATIYADSDQFQNAASAYRHAMSAECESPEYARENTEQFIRNQFELAMALKYAGREDEALFQWGIGIHTLQDWTSPSHYGSQPWSDNPQPIELLVHGARELTYPGRDSNLQRATNDALDWFDNGSIPEGNILDLYHSD